MEGTKSLVDSAQSLGYLNGVIDTVKGPVPPEECRLAALCEMAKELPLVDNEEQEESVQSLVAADGSTSHVDLFSRLKRLPIPLLASSNCLVVTWVTNRPSHLRFVRDELYPHWGVDFVAEWFWVKVTTSGQFVFPLDSPHKKPYEVLVLGRYRSSTDSSLSSSETSKLPVPEDQRLIVSVPSALHSQKPSLSGELVLLCSMESKTPPMFATALSAAQKSLHLMEHYSHVNMPDLLQPVCSHDALKPQPSKP
ncbi:hypothetical protein Q8A73_020537 [Channa argus]|nr:hypothetical protein Q8A73_020537 [Channa argus]